MKRKLTIFMKSGRQLQPVVLQDDDVYSRVLESLKDAKAVTCMAVLGGAELSVLNWEIEAWLAEVIE